MHSSVEILGPSRARLLVEMPFDELAPALRQACAGVDDDQAGAVNLSGFSGLLPFEVIDQRAGAVALPQGVQSAMTSLVTDVVAGHELNAVGRPLVEIGECGPDRPLRLTVYVDVCPPIAVPDLSAMVVEVAPVAVTDDEVEAHLEALRERFATVEVIDRPVESGDVVRIDVRAHTDGTKVDGACADDAMFEVGLGWLPVGISAGVVGADRLPAELDKLLIGARAGDACKTTVHLLGGKFAGQTADLDISITAVQQRRLPPLDDEFATQVGTFTHMEELRADLRDRIRQIKQREQDYTIRNKVLAQITVAAAIPVPQAVVADEVQQRRQWMLTELDRIGTTLAEHLVTVGKTEAQLDTELHQAATDHVCGQLVLDAIADAEDIQASEEEASALISQRAQRAGIPAQTYYQQLVRAGAGPAVFADVRRAKAL